MKNLFYKNFEIAKNKTLEFQVYFSKPSFLWNIFDVGVEVLSDDNTNFKLNLAFLGDLFEFRISWDKKRDHAGCQVYLTLLGLTATTQINDNRHWNYDEDRWYDPNEDLSINNDPKGSYLYC